MDYLSQLVAYALYSAPLIFAVIAGIAAFWVQIVISMRATAGAAFMGFAFLIQTALVTSPSLTLGINISLNDLIFSSLALAAAGRFTFMKLPRNNPVFFVWIAFGVTLFLSLGIGLIQYGSKAGVEVRDNFYFLVAGLYFASFTYTEESLLRLWRTAQWCAWGLVGVVAYRWVGLKFGFVSLQLVELVGASSEFRVVGSSPTFFLAAVGVAYFTRWLRDARSTSLLGSVIMLGLALVLQHRSVWVAAIGALGVVGWHSRTAIKEKALTIILLVLVAGTIVGSYLALSPSSRLIETITQSAAAVGESRGTHTDRIEGWKVLLSDYSKYQPDEWFIGKPYGTGYERYVMGKLLEFSPHNFFVQLLLRVGLIGLLLFVTMHVYLHIQTNRKLQRPDAESINFAIILAVLVASVLYYIPYQGFYIQGAFYGVLIGYFRPTDLMHKSSPQNG